METKKAKKANIEGLRGIFFECGLIVGLFFMIVAFSWSSDETTTILDPMKGGDIVEDIDIPITKPEDVAPPPEIAAPVLSEDIQIVDNTMDVKSFKFSTEDNDTPIPPIPEVKPKEIEKEEDFKDDIDIVAVQDPPTTWDGGDANSFSRWVASKIVYPTVPLENRIQGRVILQFRISPEGILENIKILRSVDPALDKEAVRVVSMSPKWNPGKQNGKAVGVRYTFPVNFTITD